MYKSLKRIALMLLFVCVFACFAVAAACSDKVENEGENGGNGDKVTYSVTVTKPDDLQFNGIKAQWLKSGNAASDEIALDANGKASVELDADNYTVTLKGVPTGYLFTDASVTAENHDATIAVTKQSTPPPAQTTVVMVTVRLPQGITADLTQVSAQLYKGEDAAGDAKALSSAGVAQITVARDGTYTVRLVNLPDYLEYTEASVEANSATATATIDTAPAEIEYTVTIDTEEDLDGATVTFYKGEDPVEDATDIPVENKQAKATLTAGDYTAKLTVTDAAMVPTEASLTYTTAGREASITITVSTYEITLNKPVNVTSEYTDLKVTLTNAGADTEFSANADEEGKAVVRAPRGTYDIKVEDEFDNVLGHLPVSLTESVTTASVDLAASLSGTTLNGEGRYFVTVTLTPRQDAGGDNTTSFTLKASGAQSLYTVTWAAVKSNDTMAIDDHGNAADHASETDLKFILTDGNGTFSLTYSTAGTASGNFSYIITVVKGEVPVQGTDRANPLPLQEGANSVDASWKEAWFTVPHNYAEHQLTFEQGLTFEFYNYQNEKSNIGNNEYLKGEEGENLSAAHDGWLHVTTVTTPIAFTLTAKAQPGQTPEKAEEITLDQEYSHKFTSNQPWYYKFTPTESGDYEIEKISDSFSQIDIFTAREDGVLSDVTVPDPQGKTSGRLAFIADAQLGFFHLEADTPYLFRLGYYSNATLSFKVIKHTVQEGEKSNPIEVTNVGETATEIPIDSTGGDTYFYHKITAESLNNSNLKFTFEFIGENMGTVVANFYSNSDYTTKLKDNDYAREVTLSGQSVGATIYFTVKCTGVSSLNLYINKPEAQAGDALKVGGSITISHKDSGGDALKATIPLDSSVTAGSYKIQYSVSPNPYIYGKLTIAAGSNSVSVPDGSGTIPESGEIIIEIPEGTKSLSVSTTSGAAPATYEWTFTLKENKPALGVGEPLTVDIADLSVDISAPAGTYKLTYTFNGGGQFPIKVGNYSVTAIPFSEVSTEVTITDNDKITWQNPAGASGTVTFKLEEVESAPALELEVGKALTVTWPKGDSSNNYSPELTIALKDVAPAKYDLTIEVTEGPNYPFDNAWTITVGDQTFKTGAKSQEKSKTVAIVIPKDCTEIKIQLGKIAIITTANLTLTKTGELDAEPLVLGQPYELNFDTDKAAINIPIELDAGKYHIELDFSSAMWANGLSYYVEVNGTRTDLGDVWGYAPVDFEIPAECETITIGVASVSEAFTISATVTFVGTSGPEKGDITLGEEYQVEGVEQYGTDKTIYLEAGNYKITISSSDDISKLRVSDNTGDDPVVILENGATTGKFTISKTGLITLRFLDMNFVGGQNVTVLIEADAGEEEDNKLEVGTEKTITVESNEAPVSLEITLEEGQYTITLSGTGAEKVAVKDSENILGARGVIIQEGNVTGNFTVTEAKTYTLVFEISDTSAAEVTILVETYTDNTLVVGTEKTVTVPTDNDQTIALTVELAEGDYTVKITGEKAENVACFEETFTLGDGGTIIEPQSGATGTFHVSAAKTYTLSFQDGVDYKGGFEVTILITKGGAIAELDTIVVGTEKTVTVPADGEHEISLDVTFETSGEYVITLTYETGNITVTESTNTLGAEGVVLAAGVKTGDISVKLPNTYTLTFKGESGAEVRVMISEKEEEEVPTVGVPFTVEFEANETALEEKTITITLEEKWYDITIEGDTANLMVVGGEYEDTLVSRTQTTGEINASAGEYTITFRYFAKTAASFTVTITEQN